MGTDHDDAQSEDQARRAYIRATFGDDALEGLATDQPPATRRPSTAKVHAQERNDALRQLQHEDREAQIAVVAAHRADADASDRVTADPQGASDADHRAALRHAHRNNLVPAKTSAERLIAQDERQRRRVS